VGTKAQHSRGYLRVPPFLKEVREAADLTQRDLGERLAKPQSWVHNCETGNRRVDVAEFADWSVACGLDPKVAFAAFLGLPEKAPYSKKDILLLLGKTAGAKPRRRTRKP
jgi:hypothetical protein